MDITPYQAQYYAYELTRLRSGRDADKLTSALLDAQVELTPHQVEAALFAFRSPLNNGVILADEVGLGKTIEAGLVISQKWAERKRNILIIVPANLRKQWSQELLDKFFLPSVILEKKSYEAERAKGNRHPFEQEDRIVICSYHFARSSQYDIRDINWDLVVLDEAHKLRNVYRSDNKIGRAIQESLRGKPKILLTATPLQNSLLELFGLVSIVDEYIFGDLKSFKLQFSRLGDDDARYAELRARIAPVCQRTLRRDVLQYVKYTKRQALTEDFYPGDDEWELYNLVSDYLQRSNLYALPPSQRQLMTLILRRLLASSTFAIAGTFKGMAARLERILELHRREGILPADEVQKADEQQELDISQNFEDFDDVKDEWAEKEPDAETPDFLRFGPKELEDMRREKEELERFFQLADGIKKNQKGEKLLSALDKGFKRLRELGAPQKAIIFTESTRTQQYIFEHLQDVPEFRDRIVLFNGTNNDKLSNRIYQDWLKKNKGSDRITGSPTADKRAALVEHFAHPDTRIMIATEAGAEGINLQFCNFILNFDLPWNPQRVEQRIGRCHRFGQKHDVVVLNFINKRNAADERVYKLLEEKFKLFDGVFGASDEVLGAIESGVDFERRVLKIFQECREPETITTEFDKLRQELDVIIEADMKRTRHELLENLDAEVVGKVKVDIKTSQEELDKYHQWLWDITRYALTDAADFNDAEKSFRLRRSPFNGTPGIAPGQYRLMPTPQTADPNRPVSPIQEWWQKISGQAVNRYRAGHPLAQAVLDRCKTDRLETGHARFAYDAYPKHHVLEPFLGASGWMQVECLDLPYGSAPGETQLLLAACTDDGRTLDADHCRRLLSLPAASAPAPQLPDPAAQTLRLLLDQEETRAQQNNRAWLEQLYDVEQEKLEHWADDQRQSLRNELRELETEIKQRKTEARKLLRLEDKVAAQRIVKDLEKRLADLRFNQHRLEDEIERRKDDFLNDIENRIRQNPQRRPLFTLRWTLDDHRANKNN